MPWMPELFSAPALQRLLDKRRREKLVAVPYFDVYQPPVDRWLETPRAAGVAALAFAVLFVASIVLLRHHPSGGSAAGGDPRLLRAQGRRQRRARPRLPRAVLRDRVSVVHRGGPET